jgi:hypothetical protein
MVLNTTYSRCKPTWARSHHPSSTGGTSTAGPTSPWREPTLRQTGPRWRSRLPALCSGVLSTRPQVAAPHVYQASHLPSLPLQRRVDFVLTLSWWCLYHALALSQCCLQQLGWPSFCHFTSAPGIVFSPGSNASVFAAPASRLDAGGSLGSAHNWRCFPSFADVNCERSTSLVSAMAFTAAHPLICACQSLRGQLPHIGVDPSFVCVNAQGADFPQFPVGFQSLVCTCQRPRGRLPLCPHRAATHSEAQVDDREWPRSGHTL